jgi:hypothetical protein
MVYAKEGIILYFVLAVLVHSTIEYFCYLRKKM